MNRSVDLSSKLGDLLNVPPISIELLPGDTSEWLASAAPEHAPFLFVDHNLGVPHELAYKAYLEAVSRFRAVRPRHDAIDRSHTHSAELLASSAVLLLVNPAHQTALNARKRLVLLGAHPAAHELSFADALLTLRDATKQSILWHHRRWLLRRMHPPLPSASSSSSSSSESQAPGHGDGVDTLADIALSPDAFRAEIAAVERACEAYPRNYHAWAHRFLCAEALLLLSSSTSSTSSAHARRELEAERARIRTWVERHVADYSAMQYACRLDALLRGLRAPDAEAQTESETEKGAGMGMGLGLGAHALELVRAYPPHEALWLYLRGAVALGLFPPATRGDAVLGAMICELTEKYLGEGAAATAGMHVVDEAYGHAVRFSAWRKWLLEGRRIDGTIVRKIAAVAVGDATVDYEGGLFTSGTGDAKAGHEPAKSV